MAQLLNLPIRVRFEKTPLKWEIRTVKGDSNHNDCRYAFPMLYSDSRRPREVDAWACRDEFFAVPENDDTKLLRFLEYAGLFLSEGHHMGGHWSKEVARHYKEGNPLPVAVDGLWRLQKGLKEALTNKAAFKAAYPRPETGATRDIEFPLSLEISNVVAGSLTLTNAHHALLATVFFDVARGIRFKVCKRVDCKKPFPVTSKHARKFCTQECGHLVSQRNKRAAEKKQRLEEKRSLTRNRIS